jgi:hypothetical protein
MDNFDVFVPSLARWSHYYSTQAEGSKRKLQSLDQGSVPLAMNGGGLHSKKTVAVTSLDSALGEDKSDAGGVQIKMIAPSEQLVDQAKSEIKRDRDEGLEANHVTVKHPCTCQSKSKRRVKKPLSFVNKQVGGGVTKKATETSGCT